MVGVLGYFRLDQLCPYCAGAPSAGPCAEALHGAHFYGRAHIGDPAFAPLLALVELLDGLREFAASLAARPGVAPCP